MNFLAVFGVGVFQLLCTFHFTTGQEPTFDQTEVLQRPRFFKYRRVQLDSPVPVPPKPSFNSILSSKVVVVKQNGDQGQADQSNATETFNRLTEAKEENETEAVFVPTSGVRKPCKTHSDCYGAREPDEWCPLPSKDQYIDKGCYCKQEIGACAIEKISTNTTVREYTDCAPLSTSGCNGNKKLKAG